MANSESDRRLNDTRDFWNANPCDGQDSFESRRDFLLSKEPWVAAVIDRIGQERNTVEIGCGQGTIALLVCQRKERGDYKAIDGSSESLKRATAAMQAVAQTLHTTPTFAEGNAEALDFDNESTDCVVSIGCLHHTPNTQQAIDEARRILRPGGKAYISLYNAASLKLQIAYAIRYGSRWVDRLVEGDRTLWRKLSRSGQRHRLGTILEECLGVPVMESYSQRELRTMFANWSSLTIGRTGAGLPWLGATTNSALGRIPWFSYQWLITATR